MSLLSYNNDSIALILSYVTPIDWYCLSLVNKQINALAIEILKVEKENFKYKKNLLECVTSVINFNKDNSISARLNFKFLSENRIEFPRSAHTQTFLLKRRGTLVYACFENTKTLKIRINRAQFDGPPLLPQEFKTDDLNIDLVGKRVVIYPQKNTETSFYLWHAYLQKEIVWEKEVFDFEKAKITLFSENNILVFPKNSAPFYIDLQEKVMNPLEFNVSEPNAIFAPSRQIFYIRWQNWKRSQIKFYHLDRPGWDYTINYQGTFECIEWLDDRYFILLTSQSKNLVQKWVFNQTKINFQLSLGDLHLREFNFLSEFEVAEKPYLILSNLLTQKKIELFFQNSLLTYTV